MRRRKIYTELFNKIVDEYSKENILFYFSTLSYRRIVGTTIICIPKEDCDNQSDYGLFSTLHEIGHVKKTNEEGMHRCLEEFLATQWALEKAKEINFRVPKNIIELFQNYIYDCRLQDIENGRKRVPSKNKLLLVY